MITRPVPTHGHRHGCVHPLIRTQRNTHIGTHTHTHTHTSLGSTHANEVRFTLTRNFGSRSFFLALNCEWNGDGDCAEHPSPRFIHNVALIPQSGYDRLNHISQDPNDHSPITRCFTTEAVLPSLQCETGAAVTSSRSGFGVSEQ